MTHQDQMYYWNRLTPAQRDYDRFVARRVPNGVSMLPETEGGRIDRDSLDERRRELAEAGCTCHISPPCSCCVSQDEEKIRKVIG